MVRSPGEFPGAGYSDHHAEWTWRPLARGGGGPHGAQEYLLKPVSTKALHDRIIAIIGRPRPTVTLEGYYGPLPRRLVMVNDSKAAIRGTTPRL